MGSSEDMSGRYEGSSAPGGTSIPAHYPNLPRVLMRLSILATDDTAIANTIGRTALYPALASSSSCSRSCSRSCSCSRGGATGVTVSPGTNSKDMVVVSISLGGTPRLGGPIDGTAKIEDSHEVEGEDTGRSRSRAVYGRTDGLRSGSSLSSC